MKKALLFTSGILLIGIITFSFTRETIQKSKAAKFQLEVGDIVFQDMNGEQGEAVKLATESEFSHVALVIEHEGELKIIEAVQPVRLISIEKWIKQGEGSEYAVGRIKEKDFFTEEKSLQLTENALKYLDKNYDIYFNWSDDQIYCSELVYKVYNEAFSTKLAPLNMLKDYNIDNVIVRRIMNQRYGDNIPYEDLMISPEDLYKSDLIEIVKQ